MLDAIRPFIDRATLVGWRLRPRLSIAVEPDGWASIRLLWRGPAKPWAATDGEDLGGATLDLAGLPAGVSVRAWAPPPDDVVALPAAPTDADVRALARALGRSRVWRMDRDDGQVMWLMDMDDEGYRAWLRG